jgi:hypothetical protein
MSLPECSAIYFFGSIVGVALGSSRGARPLFSSAPVLNDPSPIDDMGFCGMNFFSTAGSMVKAPQTVNGLAWEIRIFLKNSNSKQFATGIFGRGVEKAAAWDGRLGQNRATRQRTKLEARISNPEPNSNERNPKFQNFGHFPTLKFSLN